jgi:hypothetical protein
MVTLWLREQTGSKHWGSLPINGQTEEVELLLKAARQMSGIHGLSGASQL